MADGASVVVVGSGPPGAAAAVFLARAGANVLLLEGGPNRTPLGLTVRVRGLTVLKWRGRLRQRSGVTKTGDPSAMLFEELGPGGLSNHWSCAVPRFAPEDFADAERGGEAFQWPIGYDDVAPWYERVEPLLHIAGAPYGSEQLPGGKVAHARELHDDWAPMIEGAREAGRTIAPMPYAYGGDTTLTLGGTAFNSFVRLIQPERRSGRIETRFDARVIRLERSKATRRVEAVVFRDSRTGGENRVKCRAVVLAAGAIGTPEILLASSCADFPTGLGNSNGLVGRYLHDHPIAKLVVDLERPVSVFPPCYVTRPTLDRSPPLYAAACMQWSGVELLARSVLDGKPGRLRWIGFNVFGTMAPSKEDWVAIDGAGRGGNGRSGLKLHIQHPPEAKTALEQARDDLIAVLSRAGLGPRVRGWNIDPPLSSVHYGGTCRMHASPRFGVIDGWSRLHDAPNVVVADSAAFTTGPEKNPVLTSMALAARAGQHLAEELKSGDL